MFAVPRYHWGLAQMQITTSVRLITAFSLLAASCSLLWLGFRLVQEPTSPNVLTSSTHSRAGQASPVAAPGASDTLRIEAPAVSMGGSPGQGRSADDDLIDSLLVELYMQLDRAEGCGCPDKERSFRIEELIEAVSTGCYKLVPRTVVWDVYVEMLAKNPGQRLVVGSKRLHKGQTMCPIYMLRSE